MKRNISKKLKEVSVFLLIFLLSTSLLYLVTGSNCLVKAMIGIPCPTCGMTRAWLSFFRGDFGLSFFYHPLFWTIPILCAYVGYAWWKSKKESMWVIGIFFLAFITLYLIRMLYLFPEGVPMDYYKGSLLYRLWEYMLPR